MPLLLNGPTNYTPATISSQFSRQGPNAQLRARQKLLVDSMNPAEKGAAFVAGSLVAAFDSFAESFGVLDEQDMEAYLSQTMPTFGAFFTQNRATVGLVGDIGASFIPGIVAARAVRTTGILGKAATRLLGNKATPFLSHTGTPYARMLVQYRQRAASLVNSGQVTNLYADAGMKLAKSQLTKRAFLDVLIEGAAADMLIATTLRESEALFPEEMTFLDHAKFGLGANLLIGGIASTVARAGTRRAVLKATAKTGADPRNTRGLPLLDIVASRRGERGPALGMVATWLTDTKARAVSAATAGDSIAQAATQRDIAAVQTRLRDITELVFRDAPLEGLTHSYQLAREGDPYLTTALRAMDREPSMATGVLSFDPLTHEVATAFSKNQQELIVQTRVKSRLLQQELDDLANRPPPRAATAAKKRQEMIDRKQREMGALQQREQQLNSVTGVVLELDGSLAGITSRIASFQDGERALTRLGHGDVGARVGNKDYIVARNGHVIQAPDLAKFQFAIDPKTNTLNVVAGAATEIDLPAWSRLSHTARTAIFDAMQGVVEGFTPQRLHAWNGVDIGASSTFLQTEFALAMYDRFGSSILHNIRGVKTIEELEHLNAKLKFDAFQELRTQAVTDLIKGIDNPYMHDINLAKALNLPLDDSKTLRFFESQRVPDPALRADLSVLTAGSHANLLLGIRGANNLGATDPLSGSVLRGSMTNLPRDSKPVLAVMQNTVNRAGIQPADLQFQMLTQKATQIATLHAAPNAPITQSVLTYMQENHQMVDKLRQGIANLVHGTETEGALGRNVLQKHHLHREQPGFSPANALVTGMTKVAEKALEALMVTANFAQYNGRSVSRQEITNAILRAEHRGDLHGVMVARHALGAGWDIADDWVRRLTPQPGQPASYAIQLADTENNKALYQAMFGKALPKGGTLLPASHDATGNTAVVLSELGYNATRAINDIQQAYYWEINAERAAKNLAPLPRRGLHFPAQDLTKKYRTYLIDETGTFRAIVGENSEPEMVKRVAREIELAAKNGVRLAAASEAQVAAYTEAAGGLWFSMSNYAKIVNQTARAKGTSFAGVIDTGPEAFNEMLQMSLKQLTDVPRSVRNLMLDGEMRYLRTQHLSAQIATGHTVAQPTLFDDLHKTLLGSQIVDPNTAVGWALHGVEKLYEKTLQAVYDSRFNTRGARPGVTREQQREYEQMAKAFGPWNPFKSITEFAERTQNVRPAASMVKHMAALNEVTVNLAIRMFDVGIAAINLISLGATLPPVVSMLRQGERETRPQWLDRIGVFAGVVNENTAYFSPAKAVTTGVHFMFSPEGRDVARRAAAQGYFDQQAAELVQIFGRTGEGYITGVLRNFADKAGSLVDWTERQSRAIAFMTNYNVAKRGLNLDDTAAMAFAHRQANNAIADFRPANRPAIFSGAAGMPLGLFTTYMWNYLQRFHTLLENAGTRQGRRQLGLQVGLQGVLFGSESLPGWQEYTGMFMDNYDGTVNIVDRLNDALGHTGADVFLNGTVANLPRLFGASDGIAVQNRASVGLPFQSGFNAQSVAAFRTIGRVASTFNKIVSDTIADGGFDPYQAAEYIAASNLNKGVGHAIELIITGQSLDNTGNVIETNTRTGIGIVSRLLGFKPLMSDELRIENVRNRATDQIQAELKARLSATLRSKLRRGKLSNDDVEEALAMYAKAGGSAENFREFFRSQVLRANVSKIDREIHDALAGSIDNRRLGRLLYLDRG